MLTLLIILAAVLLVIGVPLVTLWLSARRGGRLFRRVAMMALRSDKARAMVNKRMEAMLGSPGAFDALPGGIADLLKARPGLVEEVGAMVGDDAPELPGGLAGLIDSQPELFEQVGAMLQSNPEMITGLLKSQPDLVAQVGAMLGSADSSEQTGDSTDA